MAFRLLYQDESLVAIDKPAGFHVHPPEDPSHRISKNTNCLALLRDQLGTYVYPVHRLDRATSGVLVFALNSEAARLLAEQFSEQRAQKTYVAVTRGWVDLEGTIDHPLASEHDPAIRKESLTEFSRIATAELPLAVGRYSTARYSLVRVRPRTGRLHQIRRHFAFLSHPLIGDTVYGDGKHNQAFRGLLGGQALLLKSLQLEIAHPVTGEPLRIRSRWNHTWHQVFELFGACPI